MTGPEHIPVMLEPILAALGPALSPPGSDVTGAAAVVGPTDSAAAEVADGGAAPGHEPVRPPLMIDATLGLGGHSAAFLARYPGIRVLGIDRDTQALDLASQRLSTFADRFSTEHGRFDEVLEQLAQTTQQPRAILFDLGVSSLQIDSDERGFAYARDTPLDMRMDRTSETSAVEVVNDYEPRELARVIRKYGEERDAKRITSAIVKARNEARIITTGQLAEVIARAVPRRPGRGHPAKRTFQALRIEVNQELESLRHGLQAALRLLAPGGRVAVLSFHSLEDRIVKQTFAEGISPSVPPGLPIIPEDRQPWLVAVTRGAMVPSAEEVAANPRAASAKLRVVERVAA